MSQSKIKDDSDANNTFKDWMFNYMLSCMAATVSETITYPLDIAKTRLQTQSKLTGQKSHGMVRTIINIVSQEGLFKLWSGLSPAIYRHFIYSGFRMSFFEVLRDDVFKKSDDPSETFPVWKAALCGATAGGMAQFLASPTDLVKVLMQTDGKRKLENKPPRVRGTLHAFQVVIGESGFIGLWRGWLPNVQRAALVNLADLATYDASKRNLKTHLSLQDGPILHSLSAGLSGLAAAILGTPADFIKTRIMFQPIGPDGRGTLYRGAIDCVYQTVKSDGVMVLYRGFLPIWTRMAPWSLTFWISYEQIRHLTGVKSF